MQDINNDAFEQMFEVITATNKPFILSDGGVLSALMFAKNKADSEMTPFEITVIAVYNYYLSRSSKVDYG